MPSLLERVASAADELRRVEEERERVRDRLRDAALEASDEGIPLSRIEKAAGLTRQQLRSLLNR